MNDIKVWSIEGNTQKLDGGAMFGHAPRNLWTRWYKPDEQNRIELSCRSLLIQIENKWILCETGIGAFFEPELKKRYGIDDNEHILLKNLKKIGLDHTDIDYVVLSHLHFDHAGGLLPAYEDKSDELLFPNATYIVSKYAFDRAKNPHPRDQASFIPKITQLLEASNRLELVTGDHLSGFFESNISFSYSDGHTPAQMHLKVSGKDKSFIFTADLIPGTPWINLPICMGYDRYPERLIEEKKVLLDDAIKNDVYLFFTHDPAYVAAKPVINDKGKYLAEETILSLEAQSI